MVSYFTIDATGENINFQKEISNMMHGFGDNPNPNAATVLLVESVVLQQLRALAAAAGAAAAARGARAVSNADLIYLMRHNKMKLKRLHDYQLKLDLIERNRAADAPAGLPEEPGRRRRTHVDVIRELDEADEVAQIKFDVIDYLRKVRADRISETLSYDKYLAYHKARCASFRSAAAGARGFLKLDAWLNPARELRLSPPALEVLSFLAYETVAEIVDAVFLIRQDARKKYNDPFGKFEGGYFCNPISLSNAVYIKSGFEGVPAITVAEVREALRRYFNPTVGLNGLFYRNMGIDLPARFIAL